MPIVRKEFDYDEAPIRMTDQVIQQAMVGQRSDYISPRQVKGRMEDIVVDNNIAGLHNFESPVPVYFAPSGFVCGECNYFMSYEPPRNGKVKAFCASLSCSQNLITKIISLPFSESCVVDPSEV